MLGEAAGAGPVELLFEGVGDCGREPLQLTAPAAAVAALAGTGSGDNESARAPR